MTSDERAAKFIEELENLMHKWGVSISTAYQHTVDGVTIAGNARLQVTANPNWQPPKDPAPADTGADSKVSEPTSNGKVKETI